MTTHHAPSPDLILNLVLALLVFAVFAGCARRGILGAKEVAWLGAAIVFFAASLVFNAVLRANRLTYGVGSVRHLLSITALMTLPLALALTYGVVALYRSLLPRQLAVVQIDGTTLLLVVGNVAALASDPPLDALVSPSDTDLRMGAGVALALKSLGGGEIEREARAQGPIAVGQAVATGAGRLPATHVIHTAIMGQDRKPDPDSVRKALDGTLKCARKIGARRIALPAFGAGMRDTPTRMVAPLTVQAVVRARKDFDEVVIVIFNRRTAPSFLAEFKKLADEYPSAPIPASV